MPFIKAYRPNGISPRTNQHRVIGQLPQMRQQLRSDASLLAIAAYVGVANEGYILDLLQAHHTNERPVVLAAPEHNAAIDFVLQLFPGHVRFCPAIFGNRPPIRLGAVVDDGPNRFEVPVVTAANHECSAYTFVSTAR